VISSGDYGKFIPPNDRWWADRRTLETVWIEFGKILYWELTPFMEFQGEKRETRDAKRETRNEKRETRKGSDER
jgi:hypothetical protein